MRVITLFLLIVLTIAEDVDISKTINPAKEVDIGETINNLLFVYNQAGVYESSKFKRNVRHCSSHVVDTCSSGTTLHHHDNGIINNQNGLALCLFESMQKCLVDHGTSLNLFSKNQEIIPDKPIVVLPIEPKPIIVPPIEPKPIIVPPIKQNPIIIPPLEFKPIPGEREPPKQRSNTFPFTSKQNQQLPSVSPQIPKATQYQSILIETPRFQTVLKTCTHVSAQTCYTDPNVSKSVLAACLMPSINQCIYPTATTPGNYHAYKGTN